jgi:hypothetical protein
VVREKHFNDSQLGKSEIGVMRTHEVQVHDLITVVDRRRDLDRISGPKKFTSSRIRGRKEAIVQLHETLSPDTRRRDQGPLDHEDHGPLIWRVELASSRFQKDEKVDKVKHEVVKFSRDWPRVIAGGHIDEA